MDIQCVIIYRERDRNRKEKNLRFMYQQLNIFHFVNNVTKIFLTVKIRHRKPPIPQKRFEEMVRP